MKLNQLREFVKQVVREEQDYQQLFKHMLDKSGKSIADMSDDEKKKFFNAVDTAYKAKSEGRLRGYNESINEISSIDGLNDVVKGQTSHIEGVKLSKDMAEHIISWMNTSPYGKKYNSWVKKNSIEKILPIAFNWGLERYLPSNLKNEFAALKSKYGKAKSEGRLAGYNESVNESAEILKPGTKVKLRGGKTGKVVRYDGKMGSPFYIVDIGQYYSIEVPADQIKTESVKEAELTAGQKKIDVDGDGEIEGSDLAALRKDK
jgi:hypothetical protein